MSDAAAYFAKKKKKKPFKFNANLVDASSVAATVHVDAPALSSEQEQAFLGESNAFQSAASSSAPESADAARASPTAAGEWEDEAVTSSSAPIRVNDEKVVDIKTLNLGRSSGTDNIAEKLRVEETKAQLAAAREGMEREAAKLKEEREKKEQEAAEKAASGRFGTAASSMASGGGKWLPPQMREGGVGLAARGWGAASATKKLDVQDEELFPDLSTAGKILEQKEKESKPAFVAPKKTAVGGGASWASKMTSSKKTPPEEADPAPVEEDTKEEDTKPETTAAPTPAVAPKPVKKLTTKKKKKDITTFRAGGS